MERREVADDRLSAGWNSVTGVRHNVGDSIGIVRNDELLDNPAVALDASCAYTRWPVPGNLLCERRKLFARSFHQLGQQRALELNDFARLVGELE